MKAETLEKLKDQLERHEGLRLKPYRDTQGLLTIGIGRNLDERGITVAEAHALFEHDLANAQADVARVLPFTAGISEARQAVFVNMAFNMGIGRLLGFKKMIVAAEAGNWDLAADELMDSLFARQVKSRALELARQLRVDGWETYA